MTMLKEFASVFLGLFLFSTIVDATSHEFVSLKVYSPDDRPSDEQLLAMLNKADLEKHNYTKEVTKLKSEPGSDLIKYHYHKLVNCSQVQKIMQELADLMPGPFLRKVGTKFLREFKARNLSSMDQCKAGLEFQLKVDKGSSAVKNIFTRRQKRSPVASVVSFCCCCCCKGEVV